MPSDAPGLSALWMELYRALADHGKEWELVEGAAERLARGVQTAASNPRALYLIAEMEVDGHPRMAGFLHAAVKLRSPVFRESVVGEIPAIFVAADCTGKGAATALLGAAMDWFRQRGITTVETAVAPPGSPARDFFIGAGFRESAAVLVAGVPAQSTVDS
jgi:GNAT superfamily N-acetyltransferase